ncbi:MAG: DUF4115 domain-containing protein [Mariprofundaceae bacterium]|nr:DUF4115 domain-containing protein [Mariprofundaceae bacterium]
MNNTVENDDDNLTSREDTLRAMGNKLSAERKKRKLSLNDIMAELKFNMSFLEALESGEWSDMPGEIYAIGFLRQYASLLDLNMDTDIEYIKSHQYALTKPLTYPDAPISPNRSWVIAAVLLFVLINIIINLFTLEDDILVEKEHSPLSQEILTDNKIEISSLPSSPYNQTEPSQAIHTQSNKQESSPPKVQDTAVSYGFFAVIDDVWLQVYQKQKEQEPQLLREVLLKSGESMTIESQAELLFTAGKPSALEVSINGKIIFAQGSLGQDGKILKLQPIQP